MACAAAKSMLNCMPMATNGCLISATGPSLFGSSKTLHPHPQPSVLSLPSKPIKFQLSFSYSFPLSLPFLKKQDSHLLRVAVIAAQQEYEGSFNWGEGQESDGGEEAVGEEEEDDGGFVEPPEEAKLYVGNLPFEFDSEKLANLFEEAGVVEIAEVIYNRETDRSRGFGFVTMSTVEEAEKAVEMFHRFELNGRSLTVNKASPKGSRVERPPRVSERTDRIYVGNLPWSINDDRLEQVFSEHGKVVSARVMVDRETGRSRGFGFVVMSSESETNDAIASLDGQSLDGRSIRVNVAEDRPRRGSF